MSKKNSSRLDEAHSKAMRKKNKDKGGGSKKYGRNRSKCELYLKRGIRERNKARRIAKDLRRKKT